MEREKVDMIVSHLVERALHHSKGAPDFINIKVEKVKEDTILHLQALPVSTHTTKTPEEGRELIVEILTGQGIAHGRKIVDLIEQAFDLRGALLLNVDTMQRLDPDQQRGLRATNMDAIRQNRDSQDGITKNHYQEALVLATKVAHAPNIVGEICISDDPNYTTGYFASQATGYIRITHIKAMGSAKGGRIFLYRGNQEDVQRTINYLQKQYVLVEHIQELPRNSAVPAPLPDKWGWIETELFNLKQNHLFRKMQRLETAQRCLVHCHGQEKDILMLASNSYLGLTADERIITYTKQVMDIFGAGSGGSRMTTGNYPIHEMLESRLAEFKETEAAIVFNSGYVANLAILSSCCTKGDVIFSDELNHASIIDGCRLSGAEIIIYRHNDMRDLKEKTARYQGRRGVIVSDAVFSMDGDIVNLPELMRIADTYGFLSMIDEAHATGVIGRTGRGTVEHYGLQKNPDILMGTLSKAVGSEGGFVCGSRILVDFLRNKSRGFIFTTSLSPATMAASYKGLDIIASHPELVEKLQQNAAWFCEALRENGIGVYSETAIIPIVIGDAEKALRIAEKLFHQGYFISAIRYPTVKKGSERLRAAVMATHTKEELTRGAEVISQLLYEENVI